MANITTGTQIHEHTLMQGRRHTIWLLVLVVAMITGCASTSNGQKISKKAEKYYTEAEEHLNWDRYAEAEEALKNAINKSPEYVNAYIKLSLVYMKTERYAESFAALQNILLVSDQPNKEVYFQLAQMGFASRKYEEASNYLAQYAEMGPHSEKREAAIAHLEKNLAFASTAIQNPVPFAPKVLSQNVNTIDNEYFPLLSADGMQLVFVKQSSMVQGPGTQEDIMMAERGVAGWSKTQGFSSNINTAFGNEGAPCLSVDGHTMYMTFCAMRENGGCDIFVSYKKGNNWSEPEPVKGAINTDAWEGQPWLSADGQTLYFSSNRQGGQGGKDLWKSHLQSNGNWGEPVNLGAVINTPFNEEKPFIHPDGETLYFSSTGHPGFGQEDFFISRKKENAWSTPVNLGYPINTYGRELGLFVDLQGNKAYYATDDGEGRSDEDIFEFDLYEGAQPTPSTYVKGIVKDKKTGKHIQATVEVFDLYAQKRIGRFQSDEVNGDFLVSLPTGREYGFYSFKKGYLFLSKYFYLAGDYDTTLPVFDVVMQMEKINQGSKVVLNNVFFDSGSSTLKATSVAELNIIASFMKENENIKIEIGGHTDNVGNDADNLKLSKARAKAVFDYLIAQDIDYIRLAYKGYGETEPVADNKTPEGRAQNRRTEMKIISF